MFRTSNSRLFPKHQTSNSILFGNTKQVIQDYDTVFDNSIPYRKNDLLRITYFRIPGVPGLHFVPWHRDTRPVTGAAADEHNLNVVDCNASVTVARPAVLNLSQWGSGGYPQPPEANLNPGPAGNFFLFLSKYRSSPIQRYPKKNDNLPRVSITVIFKF